MMNENNQNNNLNNTNFENANNNFQNLQPNQNNIPNTPQPMQPNLNFEMPESKTNVNMQQPVQNMPNPTPEPQPMQPNLNFQMPTPGMNGNMQQPTQNITNPYQNPQPMNNPSQPQTNQKSKKNIIIIAAVLVVVAVAAVIFFLNRGTTLVCTASETSMGMKMTMEITLKAKKENISSAKAVTTIDLGEYADEKDEFIEMLEESYSENAPDDVDVKITSDKDKVYITMIADEENIDELGLFTAKTIDEAREELEDDEFTCK